MFELGTCTAETTMTSRSGIVYFLADDDEAVIKAEHPHSSYLICEGDLDHVIAYVNTADLFARIGAPAADQAARRRGQGPAAQGAFHPE